VITNCPPALKKYLAASPFAKYAVWVNSILLAQVLELVTVLETFGPCATALRRLL